MRSVTERVRMVEWLARMMERWNSWRCLLADLSRPRSRPDLLLRCALVPLAELPIRSLAIPERFFALTL